jgi:hypothetical protein
VGIFFLKGSRWSEPGVCLHKWMLETRTLHASCL